MLEDRGTYYIYIPNNCKNNTDVAIYYPGAGGWRNDSNSLVDYVNTNPNKVVLINKSCSENTETLFGALKQVEQSKNIKIDDINILGHSAGQKSVINTSAKASQYGYHVKYGSILDGAYQLSNLNVSDKDAEDLAASGTTMVFYDQSAYGKDVDPNYHMRRLINHKVPIVYVVCSSPSGFASYGWEWWQKHAGINSEVIANGVIDYFSGDISTLGKNRSFQYQYWTYDYTKNCWLNISETEADKIISKRKVRSTVKLEKVTSDDKYLESELNNLLSSINNLSINDTYSDIYVTSTTKVPSKEAPIVESILDSSIGLLDKIKLEIQSIASVGKAYKDMDNFLSQAASKLNMELTSTKLPTVALNQIETTKTEYTVSEKADDALRVITGEPKKTEKISETTTSPIGNYSHYNSGNPSYVTPQASNVETSSDIQENIVESNIETSNETYVSPVNNSINSYNEVVSNEVENEIQESDVPVENTTIEPQEVIKEPVINDTDNKEPIITDGYISSTKKDNKIASKIITGAGIAAMTGAAVVGAKYGIEKMKNNNSMDDDFEDEEESE